MKRFAFATLAALAAVVASEQQAKAWFNFSLGSSTQMNVSWGGSHRCGHETEPWPHNMSVPNYNWYGPAGYPYGFPPQGGYTAPMPQGSAPAGSGSPMGFYYVPTAAYGYTMPYGDAGAIQNAYYQAPPYWYGR